MIEKDFYTGNEKISIKGVVRQYSYKNRRPLLPTISPPFAADTVIVGNVVGVHDGDTLTLRTANETLEMRLFGIDTPELGKPFGNNAM